MRWQFFGIIPQAKDNARDRRSDLQKMVYGVQIDWLI
jgi:hypothetical protein